MGNSDFTVLDDDVIELSPKAKGRGGRIKWVGFVVLLIAIALWNGVSVYTDSLWFDSLGFGSRYWYVLGLGWALFAVFTVLTFAILRTGLFALERSFGISKMTRQRVVVNKQPLDINPSSIVRVLGWIVTIGLAISLGLGLSNDWQMWTLYLHQSASPVLDPIFGNSLGFYLFTLPVLNALAAWLMSLSVILLVASVIFTLISAWPTGPLVEGKPVAFKTIGKNAYAAISAALGLTLAAAAANLLLDRYELLWTDHASFSGVTYTESNYLIPGFSVVAASMVIGAFVLFFNAATKKGRSLIVVALALPLACYLVGVVLIPLYVQSFVVKPNELGRETPYIEHNIAATRAAFNIENVETRNYPADVSPTAFNLAENQSTISNIRLWDWRALQDTLRQIQELRTYYDFPDVDVDRYMVDGELRQVMIATRELDVNKLPAQSRNWINERLVYTHGYGVTMNLVNEFTNDGKPRFILSNMPIEASADIKVTRPEIYFGESTNTNVYVKTTQKEFDHPQGETNNYSNYEGNGGFAVGTGLRRFSIAVATGDLSKLPFSDDVKAESRVLMRRNIAERVRFIAPFLKYDTDPYMVITDEGHLVWMVDAFTTADRYPYSRHYTDLTGQRVNYLRNSVKVTIDAYNGKVNFYVFDEADPIINAWRATFPDMFKNSSEMPADLRLHVRYPETFIKTQGEVYGLYHTQAASTFFGREDVWELARDAAGGSDDGKTGQQSNSLDPYQVLMPLPGERAEAEFVQVLPFTPANRNNMIAWMAGRSDSDAYGQLLAFTFPTSRMIDGPAQIEARIDQDAALAGQITLWSQQGSKVKRGDLIIMPIGTGLLYVEPIYLQADRSPMPELRLVVLATHERLTFAPNFETALKQLLGETSPAAVKPKEDQPQNSEAPAAPASNDELIERAAQVFADYQRLTSEGKLGEAGQKLDELKSILSGAQPAKK